MFSRATATKSNAPLAPTKFKGKERSNGSFWRRHAHDTPALPPSSRTTSTGTNNDFFSRPSVQESQDGATTSAFSAHTLHNVPSTTSGPKRGASSNVRSYANPYQTPDATGRRKMHKIRQQISRAVEDDLVATALRLPGLSSSGKFVRFAAERLKRKADQIKDSVMPRALSRGPKLDWMEIQKIHRKLEKEESGSEGRDMENNNVSCVPNISEEAIRQAFRRSYNVPQVIVPSALKGKQKAESRANGGDIDTDTDEDTDIEDEDKENVNSYGSLKGMDGKGSCLGEGPKASSSSAAPQSPSTPGPSNHAEAWIHMRTASPTSLKSGPVTPIKPAGQSALNVQSATPPAVTNMDFSSPSGQCKGETPSIQRQPTVTPRMPAFLDVPTIQNKKMVPQPDCNIAQTTFQPLQATVSPQTSFQSAAQFGCPQQRSFSGNIQPEAHQATFSFAPTFQQSQSSCPLPDTNHPFSGQVQQQSQSIFPGPNVHSALCPQPVPFCGNENRSVPSAAHSNPVSQPTGGSFPSFSFLSSAFQSQYSCAQPPAFPAQSAVFSSTVLQGPQVTSIQYPRRIIRRLPVLIDDPPRRSILFGPYGIQAFIKEKPIPIYQPTPIDPSDNATKFDDEAWKADRKRRSEGWEARKPRKLGPLDITNVPPLPKKAYSGRPPKGSEEDLIRRLAIERKNEAKKARKAKKRVRFLLPGEELERSPVRKKRRTDENLDSESIPEKSAPPSSQRVAPSLENRADPVMPGAYEMPESKGKAIESCPVIDHIFSLLKEQLAAYHFRDNINKRVEGDYPV
ncbi:hypothetical protein F5887DRAFT_1071448 [Amanita rubescens]|nr:hypothetical protein F5887DRAFT_1071448 [Amanita rubescens]